MKKITLFFLLAISLIFVPDLRAQNNAVNGEGSAANLEGNVYILSVFITSKDNSWTLDEKIEITSRQAQAESWIVEEAEKYGKNINFRVGSFGIDTDIVYDNIQLFDRNGFAKKDWINDVLVKIGYLSDKEFYDLTRDIYGADEVLVLIYVNQPGTGFTLVHDADHPDNAFVEGSLMCRFYDDGTEIQPATIGQEILRIFGAWNLFDTPAAGSEFPNDIMYRITNDIELLEVGELTAWRIGWASKKNDFESFRPGEE